MRRFFGKRGLWGVCGILSAWLLSGGAVHADDNEAVKQLLKRVEALEQQNKQLIKIIENQKPSSGGDGVKKDEPSPVGPTQVQKIVGDYLKEAEEKKKREEEQKKKDTQESGFEVGKNLGMKGNWTGYQPWLETEDKSFRIHVGGRTQFDVLWAHTTDRVQFGQGGIGPMNDGVNFRRGRLEVDGWYYEVFDFFCEYDFFNTANIDPNLPPNEASNIVNIPVPTDLWGSINHMPLIGTFRFGSMKPGIGLEHLTSSRWLDFMERSPLFDIYYNRNNGFEPGIQILNWTENERIAWQLGMFKNNNTVMGWNVSDGDYQVNARITGLPWYEEEGRYLAHVGFGVQYDAPDNGVAALRDRWMLRNGPAATHNTITLANVNGENQTILNPEFFLNVGPFSMQAEYLANFLDNVRAFQTQPQGRVVVAGAPGSYFSQGAYVQALYFLTGEHRPYGKTGLHGSGAAPTRIVPYRNFFWVPGHGCPNPFSSGAWQAGVRYSYSDLSNAGINGGQINEVTLGLNWFLNPNMKIQWNYGVGYRGQLGVGSSSNGTYQGFGTRFAFDF